jgi:hypothetical protein
MMHPNNGETFAEKGDDGKRFVVRADEILTAFSGTRIGDSRSRIFA